MKVEWVRVLRTTIQAACGAASTVLAGLLIDRTKAAIISAAIGFAVTVGTSFLMNLQKELEKLDEEDKQ